LGDIQLCLEPFVALGEILRVGPKPRVIAAHNSVPWRMMAATVK
jgi:hypothetical protein